MEITISYNDILSKKNLNNEIKNAFGLDGLGIILIKDLPVFECERLNILSSIKKFAELPDNIKSKYIDSKSNYSFGWSHGKEKMKKNEFDKSKGSFYNNIGTNCNENQNIWPDEIPDFKEKLNKMASLQIRIGLEISKLLDNYLFDITNGIHKKNTFYNLLEKNNNFKARALHYFPCENEKNIDNLCGWHLDHGCITTLLSPIYFSNNFNKINNINDKDGLYIKTQAGDTLKINIPENCICIQLGETFQFLSGGLLRATPHCVKGTTNKEITREQLVVFLDCSFDTILTIPKYSLEYSKIVNTPFLPENIPKLEKRIRNNISYKEFTQKTIDFYYN